MLSSHQKGSPVPIAHVTNFNADGLDPGHKIEFIGQQYDSDILRNSFHLTSAISQAQNEYWSRFNKSFYMGAERTHLTGAVINSADTRGIFLNVWTDKLSKNEIKEHALNVNNYGRENPQFINTHNTGSNILNLNTLALSWQFDNNPAFSSSALSVIDFSSGSLSDIDKYGEVVGYKYPGISTNFVNQNTAIVQDYLQSIEYVEVDNAYTSDRVKIKDQEIDKFKTDSRPITYDFSFEKSMYQIISKEMLNFVAGLVSFNNMIGEPVNKYRPNYKMLEKVKEKFFSRVQNDIDLDKFVNYYKWIDASLGRMLYELQPASSNLRSDLKNVVESHALERNKYQHKAPTLEFKEPSLPETPFLGINELLYDWKHGHGTDALDSHGSTREEDEHCLWQRERAERDNTHGRQTLNNIITKDVEGSTYVLRSLTKPYKFSVERQDFLIPGSNSRANKIDELYKIINSGREISISTNDIFDQKKCDDILDPNKKKKYTIKTDTSDTNGYFDADANLILPFTLYSSSLGGDFSSFKEKLVLANNHEDEDSVAALPGPFTRANVGGMPHRRVPFRTAEQDRPEGYDIVEAAGSLTVKMPGMNSTPKSMFRRCPGNMSFLNVSNIKHTTSSLLLGNYNKDYEVVMTNGRILNNNFFIDNEGSFVGAEPYGTSRNLRDAREQPQPGADPIPAVAAVATIVYAGQPGSGNRITFVGNTGGTSVTYIALGSGVSAVAPLIKYEIAANPRATIENLKTAIEANQSAEFTVVHTEGGNVANGTLTITQKTLGPSGNLSVEQPSVAANYTVSGFSNGALSKAFAGSSVRTQFINHPQRDYALPDRGRTEHVIVNRFSAHEASFDPSGSAMGADSYKYDKAAGELSVYSTMNYRNLRVRTDLNYDSQVPFADPSRTTSQHFGSSSAGMAQLGTIPSRGRQGSFRTRHATPGSKPANVDRVVLGNDHDPVEEIGKPIVKVASKNAFVLTEIPSIDIGYSWIRNSCTIDGRRPDQVGLQEKHFLQRNGNFRHQFLGGEITTYGPDDSVLDSWGKTETDYLVFSSPGVPFVGRNHAIIESKESILFLSQSQFGAATGRGSTSARNLMYGQNAPSFSPDFNFTSTTGNPVFVDFAGLNTIIQEPVSTSTNTSGHENMLFTIGEFYREDATGLGRVRPIGGINYLNHEPLSLRFVVLGSSADEGAANNQVHEPATGLILNSIILNRQGPYGWPSWKQIRGGDHPIMRQHRKNNTFSIIRRGTNYNVSSLMDYHFSHTVTEQINVPRAGQQRILRGQGVSNDSVTEPRTIKNYKDIFATNRFNPLTLTKHRMKRPTDSAFVELQALMIGSLATNQIIEHQMWNADEYYYNIATDPLQERGLLAERYSEEGDLVESFTFDVNNIQQIRDTIAGSVSLRISYQNELTTYANPEIIKDLKVDEIKPHRLDAIYETWFPETDSNSRNKERELRELNYIETIYPREENTFTVNARSREGYFFPGYPTDSRNDRTYIRSGSADSPYPGKIQHADAAKLTYNATVVGDFEGVQNAFPRIVSYKRKGIKDVLTGSILMHNFDKRDHYIHTFFGEQQFLTPPQWQLKEIIFITILQQVLGF